MKMENKNHKNTKASGKKPRLELANMKPILFLSYSG